MLKEECHKIQRYLQANQTKDLFRVSSFQETFQRNVNLKLQLEKEEQDQVSGQRRKDTKIKS